MQLTEINIKRRAWRCTNRWGPLPLITTNCVAECLPGEHLGFDCAYVCLFLRDTAGLLLVLYIFPPSANA
ncbi:MAG: hypothetical protein ACLVJX_10120 [Merdibacter sp.]